MRGTSEELEQGAAGSHSLFLLSIHFTALSTCRSSYPSQSPLSLQAALDSQPCAEHFHQQTAPCYLLNQSHCSFCKDLQALLTWVSSNVLTEANSPWGNPPGHRRGRGAAAPGRCRSRGPARRCCTSGWAPPTRLHQSPGKPCRRETSL